MFLWEHFIFILIEKEWICDKNQSNGQALKGSQCSLSCNNGYKLSNSTLFFYYPVFNWNSSEKKYVRRCLKGGVWSPSKPKITCDGDGKKTNFIYAYFIWYLKWIINYHFINIWFNSIKIYGLWKQTILVK